MTEQPTLFEKTPTCRITGCRRRLSKPPVRCGLTDFYTCSAGHVSYRTPKGTP